MGRPRGQSGPAKQIPTRHLVVRLGSHIRPVDDAIDEHRAVLATRGKVWFAKVGKVLGKPAADVLRSQISAGKETFLFIAVGHRSYGYKLYRCRLTAIRYTPDKSMALDIPAYYVAAGVVKNAGAWLNVSSIDEDNEALGRLRVVSSHMPLIESMSSSSSATFFVNEEAAPQ